MDKIIDKIRKMLALANNAGATEGERDNAMRMAHKWLVKYNLDMDAVVKDGVDESRTHIEARFHGTVWARSAVASISQLFFCKIFFRKSNNSDNATYTFIGRVSNATTAMEVARFVVTSVQREATAWQRHNYGHYSDYRAFATGAALTIRARCEKLRAEQERETAQEAAATSTGTSLVLANVYAQEDTANDDFMNKLAPKLKKDRGRAHGVEGGAAYHSGKSFGARVSLTPQVSGSQQKQIR